MLHLLIVHLTLIPIVLKSISNEIKKVEVQEPLDKINLGFEANIGPLYI